jgi:hypothetical protein
MTLACTACKRFISAADALCCDHNPKHIFHGECARNLRDPESDSFDSAVLSCPTCPSQGRLGSLSDSHGPAPRGSGSASTAPSTQSDSIRDLITEVLAKIESIERKLQDLRTIREQLQDLPAMREQLRNLPAMREQLRDLPVMRAQLTSLEQGVQRSLSAIEAKTEKLAASVCRVDVRQASLEARVCALEVRPSGNAVVSTSDLEERLEALEHAKLSSELILFGVKELPSEDTCAVVTGVAAALGVAISPGEMLACVRIPSRGDRPRPIIVRLSSSEARNRWIDGKTAKNNFFEKVFESTTRKCNKR